MFKLTGKKILTNLRSKFLYSLAYLPLRYWYWHFQSEIPLDWLYLDLICYVCSPLPASLFELGPVHIPQPGPDTSVYHYCL